MTILTQDQIDIRPIAQSSIVVGQSYHFDYPEGFTGLADYTAHRGAIVTVLRPCTEAESDPVLYDDFGDGEVVVDRLFKVRAADGWEGDAWQTELMPLTA